MFRKPEMRLGDPGHSGGDSLQGLTVTVTVPVAEL